MRAGDALGAAAALERDYAGALAADASLRARLALQALVERARAGAVPLAWVQRHVAPLVAAQPALLPRLEAAMALVVFPAAAWWAPRRARRRLPPRRRRRRADRRARRPPATRALLEQGPRDALADDVGRALAAAAVSGGDGDGPKPRRRVPPR